MPELWRTAEGDRVEVHVFDEYDGRQREVEIDGERCWLLVDVCARLSFRRSAAREPEWIAANVRKSCLRPVIYTVPSRRYYVYGWAINAEGAALLGESSARSWSLPRGGWGRKAQAQRELV